MATANITPKLIEKQHWKCRICKDLKDVNSFSLSQCKHTCNFCKQNRTCKRCEVLKPITEFYKQGKTHFGICATCMRSTRKVKVRKMPPRNPEKRLTKNCLTCGKEFSCWASHELKYCCYKCRPMRIEHLPILSGKNHPNWLGGHLHYYGSEWRSVCAQVRKRDKICMDCGTTRNKAGRALDVHHIIPFRLFGKHKSKEANQLSNLVALCRTCHTRTDVLYRKAEQVYLELAALYPEI